MDSSLNFPWHTKRLLLRKYTPEDLGLYLDLVSNIQVMKHIAGVSSTEQAKRRFTEMMEINSNYPIYGFYVAEKRENGAFMGLGKLEPKDTGEIELGYILLPDFWSKGYGSEISLFLVDQARLIDDSKVLMAIINPANKASKRILLKSGFSFSETGTYKGMKAEIYRREL